MGVIEDEGGVVVVVVEGEVGEGEVGIEIEGR